MKRIGIVVDHPKRDLAGCVRIAYELARRGAETVLLPHYEQGIEAPLLDLDAVLMNNARPHYRELMAGYREAGAAIFVLDTEGGVLGETGFNAPQRIAQRFRDSRLGQYVDGYLFWGERLYDAFREHSGLPEDKLTVTGCPRYDICHARWRRTLSYLRSGFFLINTNFNAVNPLLASGKDADWQPLRSQGVTDAEIEGRYRAARGVFDRLMPELRRLVKTMSGVEFVLRPHPFEQVDFYRKHFADCPNLTVDDDGDVMAVLSACRGMLHVNCGTSVEAIFLGVLPIMLEYANNDAARAMNPLPSRVSHPVWSFVELCDVVGKPETPARHFPFEENYCQHIQPWFSANDGEAGSRVAEVLLSRLPAQRDSARRPAISLSWRCGQRRSTAWQRIQGATALVLGTRATRAFRELLDSGRAYKRFDRAQVADLLQRFASVDTRPVAASAGKLSSPVTGHRMLSVFIRPVD